MKRKAKTQKSVERGSGKNLSSERFSPRRDNRLTKWNIRFLNRIWPLFLLLMPLLLSPGICESLQLRFEDLNPSHIIENQAYSAAGSFDGLVNDSQVVTLKTEDVGDFACPEFIEHGPGILVLSEDGVNRPEVISRSPKKISFRVQVKPWQNPTYRVADRSSKEIKKQIKELLNTAGIQSSEKISPLKTDQQKREFLILLYLLAPSHDRNAAPPIELPNISRMIIKGESRAKKSARLESFLGAFFKQKGIQVPSKSLRSQSERYVRGEINQSALLKYIKRFILLNRCSQLRSKNTASISFSEHDSSRSLEEKLHQALLIERIQRIDIDVGTKDLKFLSNLTIRGLRDQLNVLEMSRRMRKTGISETVLPTEMIAAILRSGKHLDVSLKSILASRGRGSMTAAEIGLQIKRLGLDNKSGRTSERKRRETLYKAQGWRSLCQDLRRSHLDIQRIREAAIDKLDNQIEKSESPLALAESEKEAAIEKLTQQTIKRQNRFIRDGLRKKELRKYYRPFPSTKELWDNYGFVKADEKAAIEEVLSSYGLDRTILTERSSRELVLLYHSVRTILKAKSIQSLNIKDFAHALPILRSAMKLDSSEEEFGTSDGNPILAAIWKSFRRYKVRIVFQFKKTESPDKNSNWNDSESLHFLSSSNDPPGKIELNGGLFPEKGDWSDWWLLPKQFTSIDWILKSKRKSEIVLTKVTSADHFYLKVNVISKTDRPINYKIVSTNHSEGKFVQRFERIEPYKEMSGPPF